MDKKYKYAYVNDSEVTLSKGRLSHHPARLEEIKISEMVIPDFIKGHKTEWGFNFHGDMDISIVRPEELITKKKWFSKDTYQVVKRGWVRLKETTQITIFLSNRKLRAYD